MLRALIFLFILLPLIGTSQSITGIVTSGDSSGPMANVTIQNIYTNAAIVTDSTGKFTIGGGPGQLIEFHKLGYKTARIRVPAPPMPPFYRVVMETGAVELDEVQVTDKYRNFKRDSLRNYETFRSELIFPKLEGLDVIRHPFSALSRRNQQLWRFQKEYAYFEQEKYIDYSFNERLVTNLTGLKGDSAQAFMKRYRPSYDMLHSMKDYEFFLYIKSNAAVWRHNEALRPNRSVGGGGGG